MKVAATGHRPEKLGGYGPEAAARLQAVARFQLSMLAPRRVISGVALGWDTAVALAAIDLGIPLVCAVPFLGQELRWPLESQRVYRWILERADAVEVICSGGYSPQKMQLRNIAMVGDCDLLLACWDGSPGGTGNCIRYAESEGRPILNCYNDLTASVSLAYSSPNFNT